jgi:hypothetical protein
MTGYEELCQAYFATEPRRLAIEVTVREMPRKVRQALTNYLEVPAEHAVFPTIFAGGHPTPYVEIYRSRFDQNGERTWELCPQGENLQLDRDGIGHFTIGICLEKERGAVTASMIFLEFSIESIDEQSAELQLARTGDRIHIDLSNPTGYADAAASIMTLLLKRMKDPPATRGLRGPIGF